MGEYTRCRFDDEDEDEEDLEDLEEVDDDDDDDDDEVCIGVLIRPISKIELLVRASGRLLSQLLLTFLLGLQKHNFI